MNRVPESGLEVKLPTGLEVATPLNGEKWYLGGGKPIHPTESNQVETKPKGRSRVFGVLAVIAVISLSIALGAGLGAGLAAQRRPSSASGAPVTFSQDSDAPSTVNPANDAPITITELGNITTTAPPSTTLPTPICPAGDSSTYIATNKPLPTIDPYWQWHIPNTTLSFKILCYTHFVAQDSLITDLQIFANVSSLNDCLDRCALFNFNARLENFPRLGCTGVALGTGEVLRSAGGETGGPWHTCWLKSNVSLQSLNDTARYPGYEGAVLLDV